MPPIWHLARNALAGRRGRTRLLVATIALAAALVVALVASTETLQASLDVRVREFIGAADARIVHPSAERFAAAPFDGIRDWPYVKVAAGQLVVGVALGRADGGTDPETGHARRVTARGIGVDLAEEPSLHPRTMLAGSFPAGPDEALIDPIAAERLDIGVGDDIMILRLTGPTRIRVSGIYKRPTFGSFHTARIILDRDVLAQAVGVPGEVTSIAIVLEPGQDVLDFCAAHDGDVEPPLVLEPAEAVRAGFDDRVQASRIIQIIATTLAFLAAGLLIVTGLTAGIAERERELALLRCVGAARRQLFCAQIVAGALLSAMGAAIGIPLGIALTAVLVWVFGELLPSGLQVPPRAIVLSGGGALVAGIVGAAAPAIGAARVAPLRMLSRTARPPRMAAIFGCVAIGAGLLALQRLLLLPDDRDTRFWGWVFVGLPALVLAHFVLAVPALLIVGRVLGPVIARSLRVPPDALRATLASSPFRFGFTAGALTLGMVVLVDAWGSASATITDWVGSTRLADGFCYRITGISAEEQEAVAAVDGVTATCPIGYLPVRVRDVQVFGVTGISPRGVVCVGFDPKRFFAMNAVEWRAGAPEDALPALDAGTGAIVAERFLEARGLGVGDAITLESGESTATFTIVGVVNSSGLDVATQVFGIRSAYIEHAISCVFVSRKRVKDAFGVDDAVLLQVNFDPSISDEEIKHRVETAVPGVGFRSGRWITETIEEIASTVRLVQATIAIGAMTIAAFAAANVLAASVHARRFEFGVVRSVGGSRATLVRLILGEAALVGITAAIVGSALGQQVADHGARQLRDLLGFPQAHVVPWVAMMLGGLALVLITLATAAPVAWRFAREPVAAMIASRRS